MHRKKQNIKNLPKLSLKSFKKKIRQKNEHFAKPPIFKNRCIEIIVDSKHKKNLLLNFVENRFSQKKSVLFLKK